MAPISTLTQVGTICDHEIRAANREKVRKRLACRIGTGIFREESMKIKIPYILSFF